MYMCCGINKGTVPQMHVVCVFIGLIRFYDQFYSEFLGPQITFLIVTSITNVIAYAQTKAETCTNVFCSTRMTNKESKNIRILNRMANESNSIVKTVLGNVHMF